MPSTSCRSAGRRGDSSPTIFPGPSLPPRPADRGPPTTRVRRMGRRSAPEAAASIPALLGRATSVAEPAQRDAPKPKEDGRAAYLGTGSNGAPTCGEPRRTGKGILHVPHMPAQHLLHLRLRVFDRPFALAPAVLGSATTWCGYAGPSIESPAPVAKTCRPSRAEISSHTLMPRTLLPYTSSPGEKTAMPILPGTTA